MNKLLIANWKMRPSNASAAVALAKASDAEGVVLAPPVLYLPFIAHELKHAALATQNIFWENPEAGGAYTGETSISMLKPFGIKYAIIGHSERRATLGETDEMIAKKVSAALMWELIPVLCVGEREEVRMTGIENAKRFVESQLEHDLPWIRGQSGKLIIAYEPIWAIGTGKSDTPANAADMARHIKQVMSATYSDIQVSVLYGGSVHAGNIAAFAAERDIDGFLVGGASADINEFPRLIEAVRK